MVADELYERALECGRQAEAARRANRHSFELLQQILTSAINAPNAAARSAYLRQAKRLVDGVVAVGFTPMPWPEAQEAAYGD